MSKTRTGLGEDVSPEALNKVAVGVIASADETDAVARVVMRAHSRGHHVLLMHSGSRDPRFLPQFGTTVLTPDGDDLSKGSREVLLTAARNMGFPGLVFHPDLSEYLDYSQMSPNETDSYVVKAETRLHPARGTTPSVLVAVPAYNEADSIGDVVREAASYADVVVVDDGSDDDTALEARAAGATVVEHETNRGYGSALKTAFRYAADTDADHLVVVDADGQHDPSDIPDLVSRQRETGAEIVIGSRFTDGADTRMPLYRLVGVQAVNLLTNLSLGRIWMPIKDTQSGFRAYNERAVRTLSEDGVISDHMGASTDILYHADKYGYDVEEVGTDIWYNVNDGNSQHPVTHGLQLVANILRIVEYDRPIAAIGAPGFISAVVGLGLGYWAIRVPLGTGTFPTGLTIASVFFTLTGVFACFTSVILHSLDQRLGDDLYTDTRPCHTRNRSRTRPPDRPATRAPMTDDQSRHDE